MYRHVKHSGEAARPTRPNARFFLGVIPAVLLILAGVWALWRWNRIPSENQPVVDRLTTPVAQIEDAAPLPEDRRHPNLDICTHGTKHIAFAVKDVHKLINSLKKRGVDIAMDVSIMENKAMAFIRDNAGNLIEIVEAGSAWGSILLY